MKRFILGLALAAGVSTAARVEAITVDEVKGLTRAGASDSVILAKIEADSTVFRLTVDEIVELREAKVSDTVITFMINTGKETPQAAVETQDQGGTAPETVAPDDENQGDQEDYRAYDDDRYYGSVGVSYGYYYPHWPGYMYTWYYDPFWWPSWSFYWAYWCPYPYYYWYPDPWSYSNNSYYSYYRNCYNRYYPYPDYGYGGSYRVHKGRNVGNRDPIDTADRILKRPSPGDGVRVIRSQRTTRIHEPRPSVTENGTRTLRNGVRAPGARNPAVGTAPGRSRNVTRPAPQPAPTHRVSPSRPSRGRVDRGRPAPAGVGEVKSGSPDKGNSSANRDDQHGRSEERKAERVEKAPPSPPREEAKENRRDDRPRFNQPERGIDRGSDRGNGKSEREGKGGSGRGGNKG